MNEYEHFLKKKQRNKGDLGEWSFCEKLSKGKRGEKAGKMAGDVCDEVVFEIPMMCRFVQP